MTATGLRRVLLCCLLLLPGCRRAPYGEDLMTAIVEDDEARIGDVLSQSPQLLNARDSEGETPLTLAINQGRKKVVRLLLEQGADPNVFQAANKSAPLHVAIRQQQSKIVRWLLEQGAAVDARDSEGLTPLLSAVEGSKDFSLVELLLERGGTIRAVSNDGRTVLHLVQNAAVARLLVAKGADVKALDRRGISPLGALASNLFDAEIAELLLANGADPNSVNDQKTPVLIAAARAGQLQFVRVLLQYRSDIRARDPGDGYGVVHAAVVWSGQNRDRLQEYKELVRILVAAGADVNAKAASSFGATPLALAAESGNSDMVAVLLQSKAKPNIRNEFGLTPLGIAIQNNFTETAELLRRSGGKE